MPARLHSMVFMLIRRCMRVCRYFKNADGSFTIYTKGADRMTSFGKWVGQAVMGAFGSGELSWVDLFFSAMT